MRFLPVALILIASCARQPVANLTIDAGYIPSDTVTLAGVRVAAIRATALYQKYGTSKSAPNLDAFVTEYGFDPRTGLDEVLVAANGKEALVIAKGRFNKASPRITIVNPGLALAGPESLVRAAMEQAKRKQPLPARLKPLLEFVPAEAQIWMVSGEIPRTGFNERSNLANADKILAAIDSLSAWADLSKGLRLGLDGHCADEPGAKRLQTQLKGLIGMGRLSTPDNQPRLLRLYDAIEVKQEGRSLHLSADITMELIEDLIKQLESFRTKTG